MPKRVRERVQTWPMKVANQATIIRSQNELLLLDLLIAYKKLKRGDPGRLKECLPELKKLVGIIFQAAKEVNGKFAQRQGNSPVWLDVSLTIKTDYPDTRTKLATIEQRLSRLSPDTKEICKDLILIINTVAGVHADILRIPIPEQPPASGEESLEESTFEEPAILDINSLKLIRNSGEFKFPDS